MYPGHRRRPVDCIALMLDSLLLPAGAFAADAHQAVKPKPGDIVVPRNVSRPAYRRASPGLALMVKQTTAQAVNEGGSPAIL
jgi:hypothetical protein